MTITAISLDYRGPNALVGTNIYVAIMTNLPALVVQCGTTMTIDASTSPLRLQLGGSTYLQLANAQVQCLNTIAEANSILETNGLASFNTYVPPMNATGITNTGLTNTWCYDVFTGTSITRSNRGVTIGNTYSMGTLAAPGTFLMLRPGDAVVGTGCAAAGSFAQ